MVVMFKLMSRVGFRVPLTLVLALDDLLQDSVLMLFALGYDP